MGMVCDILVSKNYGDDNMKLSVVNDGCICIKEATL